MYLSRYLVLNIDWSTILDPDRESPTLEYVENTIVRFPVKGYIM